MPLLLLGIYSLQYENFRGYLNQMHKPLWHISLIQSHNHHLHNPDLNKFCLLCLFFWLFYVISRSFIIFWNGTYKCYFHIDFFFRFTQFLNSNLVPFPITYFLFPLFNDSCRISYGNTIRRNIRCHYRPCPNHSPITNGYTSQYNHIRS